ncbi:MAG: SRPBCC domain-containing protein [Vicinamibacterales bacterium]
MPDILHRLPIAAPIARVFETIATPAGLNAWWTLDARGVPGHGEAYDLGFGPEYQWKALVAAVDEPRWIEWEMIEADADWTGTRVGARLTETGERTIVDFYHTGWRHPNAHFRTSSCCWAQYLRILRRFLEHGERVPYADRLDV